LDSGVIGTNPAPGRAPGRAVVKIGMGPPVSLAGTRGRGA
jgi:hypothetical protein